MELFYCHLYSVVCSLYLQLVLATCISIEEMIFKFEKLNLNYKLKKYRNVQVLKIVKKYLEEHTFWICGCCYNCGKRHSFKYCMFCKFSQRYQELLNYDYSHEKQIQICINYFCSYKLDFIILDSTLIEIR